MASRDFYDILGVAPTATAEQIKAAYRKRAKEWHPDGNTRADATARAQEINAAYDCLKNALKRAAYDRKRQQERASAKSEPPRSEAKPKQEGKPPPPPGGEANPKPGPEKPKPKVKPMSDWNWPDGDMRRYGLVGAACVYLLLSPFLIGTAPQIQTAAAMPPPVDRIQPEQRPAPPPYPPEIMQPTPEMERQQQAQRQANARAAALLRGLQEKLQQATATLSQIEEIKQRIAAVEKQLLAEKQQRLDAENAEKKRIENARLQQAKLAQWEAMTTRLFGAPYRGGSPCMVSMFENARCTQMHSRPFDLALTASGSTVSYAMQELYIRVTDTTVQVGITPIDRHWDATFHQGALGNVTRTVLMRLGFTQDMLRLCAAERRRTTANGAFEYACLYTGALPRPAAMFSVERKTAIGTPQRPIPPLPRTGDTGPGQTSPPAWESPNTAFGRR